MVGREGQHSAEEANAVVGHGVTESAVVPAAAIDGLSGVTELSTQGPDTRRCDALSRCASTTCCAHLSQHQAVLQRNQAQRPQPLGKSAVSLRRSKSGLCGDMVGGGDASLHLDALHSHLLQPTAGADPGQVGHPHDVDPVRRYVCQLSQHCLVRCLQVGLEVGCIRACRNDGCQVSVGKGSSGSVLLLLQTLKKRVLVGMEHCRGGTLALTSPGCKNTRSKSPTCHVESHYNAGRGGRRRRRGRCEQQGRRRAWPSGA